MNEMGTGTAWWSEFLADLKGTEIESDACRTQYLAALIACSCCTLSVTLRKRPVSGIRVPSQQSVRL
jgi:hypothetical protein